jgi:hypothetical protein
MIISLSIVVGFCAALFVGALFLPGPTVEGFRQPDGRTKHYRINGLALWIATHLVLIVGWFFGLSLAPLVDRFWSLFAAANLVALIGTAYLYLSAKSRRAGPIGTIKDLWFGAELNPTLLGVDLKTFAYQPSLIGLWLLNLAFAYRQYETLGTLTPQMIAYQTFCNSSRKDSTLYASTCSAVCGPGGGAPRVFCAALPAAARSGAGAGRSRWRVGRGQRPDRYPYVVAAQQRWRSHQLPD